jgi:hypothetical protein
MAAGLHDEARRRLRHKEGEFMAKTVKMKVYFPGMMSGQVLPRQGEPVTVSDIDADLLVKRGYAEYAKADKAEPEAPEAPVAPEVETRVVAPAETADAKRGPGRPPKANKE